MSEQTTNSDDNPSDGAFDLVASVKNNSALNILFLNLQKIRWLLNCSSDGIVKTTKSLDEITNKIDNAEEDEVDEKDEEAFKFTRVNDNIVLRLTDKEVYEIKEAIFYSSTLTKNLHFYLHNILLAAVWSAFEGYMQSALAELFVANPDLLSSENKISIAEVVTRRNNVIEYLIAKEIDEIGRKSFKELQLYIRSRLKIQFSNKDAAKMSDAYFLRNVIAHSAGLLRKEQLEFLPDGVDVCDLELQISQSYLNETIDCIDKAVHQFDKQLREKFCFAPQPQLAAVTPPLSESSN